MSITAGQGLASQTSSHGVASFVGQRHNTMRWPPAFFYNMQKVDSLLSEVHTHSYSPSESSVLNVDCSESKNLKANWGHHNGSQVNAAAPS